MSTIASFDPGPSLLPPSSRTRVPITLGLIGILLASGCNAIRYETPRLGSGPEEGELVLTLEPVDIPAHTDHDRAPQPFALHVVVPEDGWAQGFTVEVVDAEGDTVPSRVLHHVKVLAPGPRELFKPIALRMVGAGSETRSHDLRTRAGVRLARGDSLLTTAMLHNPLDEDLRGVRVRVRIRYLKDASDRWLNEVYPFFLHVTAPDQTSDYDLPPGRSERSWEARPGVGGRILTLGGHLHRYGAGLRFEDASTGRVIWETKPVLDADGQVLDIPRRSYVWGRGPRLDAGRLYRVTAIYDNPTGDTLRAAGMGTVGGVFRPDGPWPQVDPALPLYVFDLDREISGHAHPPDSVPDQVHPH